MKKRLGLVASNGQEMPGGEKKQIYITKAIALLSRHPFFETFEIFLKFLYQKTVSNATQTLSIERHLALFMSLPFPTPRVPRINAFLSVHHPIQLSLPRYRLGVLAYKNSFLDSVKITIMLVRSRNMASLKNSK